MKYRFILPAIFLLIAMLFIAVSIKGAGHGPNAFDFILYFTYPACLLTGLLESLLGGPDWLWLSLCILACAIQYFLVGYIIDKLSQRRRKTQS